MMQRMQKFLGLIALMSLAAATSGCVVDMSDMDNIDSSYNYNDGGSDDPKEDRLIVKGSGETLNLSYNTQVFTAKINWKDGNYYFAPDADGQVTGNKIICVASVSDDTLEGDCFRSGHVCHFSYYNTTYGAAKDEDVYYKESNSCKTAASVGPFLVPLDSPLCGEDPYPACPSDKLFPTGPLEPVAEPAAEPADGPQTPGQNGDVPSDNEPSLPAPDTLISALCGAVSRCDQTLKADACTTALKGNDGKQIWDQFGLSASENQLTSTQVQTAIKSGSVTVNAAALEDCIHELVETCDNGETVSVGNYLNAENLIPEDGSCSSVLGNVIQ